MGLPKLAALTFDDGPAPDTTIPILDILQEFGVPASFFVVGENITEQTAPVLLRAVSQKCEICSHSFSHPPMPQMTAEEIRYQIDETSERIRSVTGTEPRFFRPPYIAVSDAMFDLIDMPFIAGFGCNDFDPAVSTEQRVSVTMSQLRDGAVILLHDAEGNAQTVEAVRILIPEILAAGYQFTTVTELFAKKKIVPQKGILYSFAEQTTMYV